MESEKPGLVAERQGATDEIELGRARLEARRRILAGGLASVPVILTLTSRPAFAGGDKKKKGPGECGPSGLISGNLSQNAEPDEGCLGKTPGYWKTHVDKCSNYITPGPCNPIDAGWGSCDDYSIPTKSELEAYLANLKKNPTLNRTKIRQCENYLKSLKYFPQCPPFGTPFAAIFGSGLTQDPNTTMMQALWLDDTPPLPPAGSGGPSPVLAHSAAAYLNACEFGKDRYGLSPQGVVELVVSMILTDPLRLKEILEALNSRS